MINLPVNKNLKAKENFADNQFHNILTLFDVFFFEICFSPQVNLCPIITDKHGIYELPYELLNDLRLRILRNEKISGNCINHTE